MGEGLKIMGIDEGLKIMGIKYLYLKVETRLLFAPPYENFWLRAWLEAHSVAELMF